MLRVMRRDVVQILLSQRHLVLGVVVKEAEYPLPGLKVLASLPDAAENLCLVGRIAVHIPQVLAAGEGRMAMGVDEPRDDGPAGKIDSPRAFGSQGLYLGIVADSKDSVPGNGDGLGPGNARVDGDDVAVQEQKICLDSGHASLVPRGSLHLRGLRLYRTGGVTGNRSRLVVASTLSGKPLGPGTCETGPSEDDSQARLNATWPGTMCFPTRSGPG